MKLCLVAFLALLTIASPQPVLGQYPNKPVTIIVGFDTGSVGDQIARGLAEAALKHFPQPFVVANRPGASGSLAMSEALRAQPDGYTLGLGTVGILTIQPHLTALQYSGPTTYVPVAKLVNQPNMLMVRTGAPWKTVLDFLEYARAHPGQVTVGVPGLATVAHLNLEQLKRVATSISKWKFSMAAASAGSVTWKNRCRDCRPGTNHAAYTLRQRSRAWYL